MAEEKTTDECFQYNQDTRLMMDKMDARHTKSIETINDNMREMTDKLINRLPPWVMFLFSALTLLLGLSVRGLLK